MSFQCYTPRALLRSASLGGLFGLADGSRHAIPDHWLAQATLLHAGNLLRLNYTFCTVEIAGQGLDPIFEDASIGKIGAVQVAPPGSAPGGQLWVTSIIVIAPSPSPESQFEGEVVNA
jgi:hypothetical protein